MRSCPKVLTPPPDELEMRVKSIVQSELPVVVIGAGPVGLAAAAHLLERGIEPLVLEGADSIGASLNDFGHVQLFSPWRYNIDASMARMLMASGWQEPDLDELPFAIDVVEKVLRPFAALPEVSRCIRLHSLVGRLIDRHGGRYAMPCSGPSRRCSSSGMASAKPRPSLAFCSWSFACRSTCLLCRGSSSSGSN